MITIPKGGELEFSKFFHVSQILIKSPTSLEYLVCERVLHVIVVGDKDNTFIAQSSI